MKHWIRFFCLSLLSIVAGMASAQDVEEISTVDQLKAFRDAVNSGTSYAGKTVKLTSDLDLNSEDWFPIGYNTMGSYPGKAFKGEFDGCNHTISNLKVYSSEPNYATAGFFGSIETGSIKNLTLKNVDITSTHFAGGIVAYTSNDPTIENCHVIGGTIKSTPEFINGSYDNGDKAGGIMGYATASSAIKNCTVQDVTISAYRDLGGIVGYSDGAVTYNTTIDVKVTQDLTNGYKSETPTTIGDIVGRGSASDKKYVEENGNKALKSVAKIGETKYETLEAAFAAAQDGETITLLADCAGNGIKAPQGTFSQGLTVDFAGHTYTVDGATVGSTGTETNGFQLLKNNKITFKNGTITSEKAKILIQNYSDLTLEGMTLTLNNANYTAGYTLSNNNGNVVIDGTTINANPAGGFAFDVCRYASYPSVSVTVKGESVINGDAEVSASGSDAKDGFKLMLEAGTMTGNIVLDASAKAAMAAAPEKALVMKSETFTKDAPADYKWVTAEEGTLKLVAKEYVAQIGNNKYETLEAAFAAAQDGETITLLADCAGNGIKAPQGTFSQGLTVDFAGHTYTVDGATVGSTGTETNGFQLLKENKITFKGGTITSKKAKILVQNYSDLTLEGMTLTLNNANYTSAYTLSNNNGNIVIDGTTINANPAGGFAFDVCRYASYPSVSVTVKGESVINGDAEVSASGSDAKDGFSLMLESCTLTGEIVLDATAKAAMAATPEKATVSKSNSLETIAAPEEYKWKDNGNNTSSLVQKTYVAKIGDVKYETLKEALDAAKDNEDIVVELLADATLDVTAWDGEKNALSIGSANTKTITINGNNHQLTFNNKNSDWNNIATMNDAETKLILNDIALTNSGYNNGPWNRHDINFNCAVELTNVTSDKALAFKNDASLKNVTVTETGDVYAIWVQPKGQNISIDGLTINAANGRGIKIDDQYVDNPEQMTLDIANATFNTKKKSAILVKSAANTVITAGEGINIENVASDKENLVWVDEDRTEEFYKVTVNGATVVPESKESDYVACVMNGEQRWGFYKKLSDAVNNVEEGFGIKLHQTTTEAVEVSKALTITKNGFTADNVTAGEGFKKFETETEVVIKAFNPVCAIGDEEYESLQEAVNAAGTNAATITLLTDAATDGVITGNGVKVQAGQNITFNLKGLTYNVDKTVGSAGTETNGFQLLKGSTVKFTNGTLTSATAQILLQNYSDLTLDGVTVNAGSADYAVSNNFGSLTVTGETNINAKSGGCAFDLWYGMYRVYDDGISIVFDENFTGSVTGKVEYGHHSSATNEDWRDKTKLEIKAGKFDIEFANGSAGALDGANIKISGGVFAEKPADEYCAEGYIVTDNTDDATKERYPFAVKTKEEAGIYELIHDVPFKYVGGDDNAKKITYTRTFEKKVVNNFQTWYVPFDYTISNKDLENFKFYKIHLISAAGKMGGEVKDKSAIYIYVQEVGAGTKLSGNRPYVLKAKSELQDFVFEVNNTKLYAKDESSRLHVETTDFNYDFYGNYDDYSGEPDYTWYTLNKSGQLQGNSSTATLRSYRWYIKTTARDENADYAKPNFFIVEGDGETDGINNAQTTEAEIEGIYTLGGIKVEHLVKGVNIIKYTDGRTKKINVK